MFQNYCRIFHFFRERRKFVPKGILIPHFPDGELEASPLELCEYCSGHFVIAGVKKIVCRFNGTIPCSRCEVPCSSEEHRNFVSRIMLFRVMFLFLTFQWKPIFEHLVLKKDQK